LFAEKVVHQAWQVQGESQSQGHDTNKKADKRPTCYIRIVLGCQEDNFGRKWYSKDNIGGH
jgi:hypothetical protein